MNQFFIKVLLCIFSFRQLKLEGLNCAGQRITAPLTRALLCAADRWNSCSTPRLKQVSGLVLFFVTVFRAVLVRKVKSSSRFTVEMSYRIGKFHFVQFINHAAPPSEPLKLSSLSSEAWMELGAWSLKACYT